MTAIMHAPAAIEAPLSLWTETVRPEWIDYNGHMNVAYYVLAFDHATDEFFDFVGLDAAYREGHNASTFAVESHVCYVREVHEGDPMRFTTQLLGYDEKRLHYFHRMFHGQENYLAATLESLSLHVDMAKRRVAPMPTTICDRLAQLYEAHSALDTPPQAGRVIKRPTPGGKQRTER